MHVITHPSAADIRDAVAQFDGQFKILEGALAELFAHYPRNTDAREVLLKATALNTLYSTQIPPYGSRIPTIFHVTDHIVSRSIDAELSRGDAALVERIASVKFSKMEPRFYYSFSTKYCSWHNSNAYPIFDSRVVEYLWYLRKHNLIKRFEKAKLWKYPIFKGVIEEFKANNDLGSFSFKQIDKFLYFQGVALLAGRSERELDNDGTIRVPVPGQPDEMELSVENFASPEEAELSRERFTDSAGWGRVTGDEKETCDGDR